MNSSFRFFLYGLFLAALKANAAVYYVNVIDGNDNNTGTAQSAAWKTLAKVSSTSFTAGDSINFKCGQTWRETLTIRSSGTASQPITFGSYGDCSTSKPEIRGSTPITGWTKYFGQIYVASFQSATDVSQLFIDGKLMRLAKHPNAGYWSIAKSATSNGNCASAKAPYDPVALNGACSIDLSLSANHPEMRNKDLKGAGLHIKTQDYWIDSSTISTYDGNSTVVLNTRSRFLPEPGRDYYFNNKLWMLDEAGEWFYDKNQQKIYVWLPDSGDPNAHLLEASIRSYGIYADSQKAANYVKLTGLSINQVSTDGIFIDYASNVIIENIDVKNSRRVGVMMFRANNAQIQSTKISNSGREGIVVRQSNNAVIKSNTITDTATSGFYLGSPGTSFGAIATDSSINASITQNTVTNAGYIGIRMQIGSSVSNNTLNNTCLVLTDCSAIYVNGTGITNVDPPSIISGNVIINVGSMASTGLAAGIYLDDFANHVSVATNTITNAERGIFLHLAHDNSVTGNIVKGSRTYSLNITENLSSTYAGATRNNSIIGNTFTQANGREVINLTGDYANINFATFSKNTYSSNQATGILVQTQYKPKYPLTTVVTGRYTLASWQSTKQDLNSTLLEASPSPPQSLSIGNSN